MVSHPRTSDGPEGTLTTMSSGPLDELLTQWLPGRRWYPAKGRAVTARVVADLALPSRDPVARVAVLVVELAAAGTEPVLVQVPVVTRPVPLDTPGALIGTVGPGGATTYVHDGPQDPAYVTALTDMLAGEARHASPSGWVASRPGPLAVPRGPQPPASRLLSGEQSNTSVIVQPPSGPPVIVKVFRTLQDGDNPDIVLQNALAAAGSARVATPAGALHAAWTGRDGRDHGADLAFASQFLPDAPDAWRTATAAVAAGTPFDDDARDLGAATAEVHRALATELPTEAASPRLLTALAQSLVARCDWAVDATGGLLDGSAAAARQALERVSVLTTAPAWQRIHGDLHLGQVLRPPGQGWVLLDFEGEPLRPLADRQALDNPLRDVASMLRSFDYAGAFAGEDGSPATARWVAATREAFCDGYAAAGGGDPRAHPVLLAALELEKAMYELVYETRNRPDWVRVPLGAVRRLTGAGPH